MPDMDRPYIHLNCAASVDGKISLPDGSRLRISGEWDMRRVHRLRAELGSILVGAGTITADDPKLTVKEEYAGERVYLNKIVIDGRGRIPEKARFLSTPGRSFIVTSTSADGEWLDSMKRISGAGADIDLIILPGDDGLLDLGAVLSELMSRGIDSILVEGGSRMIWEFVSGGFFDKFTIYYGPMIVGGTGPSVASGPGFPEDALKLVLRNTLITGDGGILIEYSKE